MCVTTAPTMTTAANKLLPTPQASLLWMAANPCNVRTIYPGIVTHTHTRARSVNPVLRPPSNPWGRPASQAVCTRTSSHTAVIVSDG